MRPFNAFGPYQSERAIIPELIVRCLRGQPIETTEGLQTREFNFVDNLVDGFIAAAQADEVPPGPVNIGSGQEISIRDLARTIHRSCNSKSELRIGKLGNRPTEIWRMSADNQLAKNFFGWSPHISFEEGLSRTITWFEKYLQIYFGSSGLRAL